MSNSVYQNPKINFGLTKDEIIESLRERLDGASEYHMRSEQIGSSILEMMLAKTLMYGGTKKEDNLTRMIVKSYYQGVGRKAERLPDILDKIMSGDADIDVRKELLDTIIDVAGYAILSLNSFGEELQNEV